MFRPLVYYCRRWAFFCTKINFACKLLANAKIQT